MRVILTLIIASAVGSTLIGGLRSFLSARPANSYQTVVDLYKQDKPTTIKLIEEATFKCLPGLSSVKSDKLRNAVPRIVAYLIEAKVWEQQINKAEFKTRVIDTILTPAANGASISDIKQMAELLDQNSDKQTALVSCIGDTVVAMAKSTKNTQQKTLLDDTELRGI